ncbi:MAG: ATP-dependent DNA helicase RecG [Erysipelotrichales bacterium]|nr:ATP-dependent DNA helicase RecG [Erysipelotrichales bacterium]
MYTTPKFTAAKKKYLDAMGLTKAEDLIFHYPYRYETFVASSPDTWNPGDVVLFAGTIAGRVTSYRYAAHKSISRAEILTHDRIIHLTVYNQPWMSGYNIEDAVTVIGKYEGNLKVTAMKVTKNPLETVEGIHPVYSLKEGLSSAEFQKLVKKCFECNSRDEFRSFIPSEFIARYRLMDIYDAYYNLHFPTDKQLLEDAVRTVKYEEFLKFQVVMESRRILNKGEGDGFSKSFQESGLRKMISRLPFELTEDQKTALREILEDLKSEKKMVRLLEGDVGSGKTVVAAISMYAAVLAGYQAVMMAPTEILAKQHEKTLKELFEPLGIPGTALYSSLDAKERAERLVGLKSGKYMYASGTHALFQEDVEFKNLGYAVIDEQQRFGVEQRGNLSRKGNNADILMMSATPIPRTLATSVYGDMDISIISAMPQSRKPVVTELVRKNSIMPVQREIESLMEEGNGVYIVCPSIEKNDAYKRRDVQTLYQNLKKEWEGRFRVGFVHGKLSSEEKDQAMNDFRDGKYNAMITTTVVEVGVDIPFTNVMVIYDAECFGLSQLHQLRGRVGRHGKKGYCYLLTGSKDPEVLERLAFLANTSDGFKIAQYDLERRGPGDLLGNRQSGAPGFILGDFVRDQNVLIQAQKDARYIVGHIELYPEIQEYLMTEGKKYLDTLG